MKFLSILFLASTAVGCVGIKPAQAVRYEDDIVKIEVEKVLTGTSKYRAKLHVTNKHNRSIMWHTTSMECYKGAVMGTPTALKSKKRGSLPTVNIRPSERLYWDPTCSLSASTDKDSKTDVHGIIIKGIFLNPDNYGVVQGDLLKDRVEVRLHEVSDIPTE